MGNEGNGCHEGNEGDEEEANLCQTRKASSPCRQDHQVQGGIDCILLHDDQDWQDCEQGGQRPRKDCFWPLECSSPASTQGSEHQGILSYQEGHSTLQEGQGALRPMKAVSNL